MQTVYISLSTQEVKITSPDYKNVSPEQACEDFKARIKLYETQYEPLCLKMDNQVRFLKVVNTGKRFVVNRAEGITISCLLECRKLCTKVCNSVKLTQTMLRAVQLSNRLNASAKAKVPTLLHMFQYNQGPTWQRLQTTSHPMWYTNCLNTSRRFDLRAFVLPVLTKVLRSKRREVFLSILGSCSTTLDANLLHIFVRVIFQVMLRVKLYTI